MALVLVTGASTGLGAATAEALVADGHDVVLHARAEGRLDGALLERSYAAAYGDLADPDAVRALAEQLGRHGRFDAVIHNAGVFEGPDVGRVNVVAPYLLVASMAPPARTIFLSSNLHRSGSEAGVRTALADPLVASWSYSDSKLCITALTLALARSAAYGMVHAVDPGWVPTRMGGAAATDDLDEGHRTQVWLATAPAEEVTPATGGYWYHHAARTPDDAALDPALQDHVVARLAEVTGVHLAG